MSVAASWSHVMALLRQHTGRSRGSARARHGARSRVHTNRFARYFDSVAEMLTKIADGTYPACGGVDGRLVSS